MTYDRKRAPSDTPPPPRPEDEAFPRDRDRDAPPYPRPTPIAARRVKLISAADIPPARQRWLWDHRIPLGALSLFAGEGGLGKSIVTLDVAAQVTRGELPGEMRGTPRSVVIVAAEDAWPQVIIPRLIAAGADLDRVHRVDVVDRKDTTIGEIELPVDLDQLRDVMLANDVALLVLDPLTSRIGSQLDTHKDAEVRLALEPLTVILEATGVACIGIIHLNKKSGGGLARVMGSGAFANVARSVSMFAADPDDPVRSRLFETIKNNVGRCDLPTRTYSIESVMIPVPGDAPTDAGRTQWGADSTSTVRAVMEQPGVGEEGSSLNEAMDWLSDYLEQEGRAPSKKVKDAARVVGINERTLERARVKLKIPAPGAGFPRVTWWTTPGYTPPE